MRFSMNTTTRIPKLFLTEQTVNPLRFPLHVPNESIADEHLINIQIFCRKLHFSLSKDFVHYFILAFKIRSGTQFHGCTDLTTLHKSHTYLPLPQIVCLNSPRFWETRDQRFPGSLSLLLCRVGRREPWEWG